MYRYQARRMTRLYQLREPRVVEMTGKIARLDVRLPVHGYKQNDRDE
jgi:hypothetical protein